MNRLGEATKAIVALLSTYLMAATDSLGTMIDQLPEGLRDPLAALVVAVVVWIVPNGKKPEEAPPAARPRADSFD